MRWMNTDNLCIRPTQNVTSRVTAGVVAGGICVKAIPPGSQIAVGRSHLSLVARKLLDHSQEQQRVSVDYN